jgi:hypothetical protein
LFLSALPQIVDSLETIANWREPQTASNSSCLLQTVTSVEFVVALYCLSDIFSLTIGLSKLLQKENTDLMKVKSHVQLVISCLEEKRRNADEKFQEIWKQVEDIAHVLGIAITLPRIARKQTNRSNVMVSN